MVSSSVSVLPPPSWSPFLGTYLFPHGHESRTSFSQCLLPLNHSWNWQRRDPNNFRFHTLRCRLAKAKDSPCPSLESLVREPHKYFDQVIITARAGDGGHGATLSMPNPKAPSNSHRKQDKEKARIRSSYKRDFDGSLILPMGGHGGDVVIYADEGKDSLLEFHKKGRYNAKRGGNVDTMGVLTSQLRNGLAAPTLRIPVPLGTVVKLKRGKFLADLARHGDEILVARGGQGGISLLEMPEYKKKKMMTLTTNVIRDENDKVKGEREEDATISMTSKSSALVNGSIKKC